MVASRLEQKIYSGMLSLGRDSRVSVTASLGFESVITEVSVAFIFMAKSPSPVFLTKSGALGQYCNDIKGHRLRGYARTH